MDRAGPATTALTGLLLLAVIGGAGAALDRASTVQTSAALVLLGLGWNLGLVGGSALLARAAPIDGRPRLEAVGEVAMGAGAAVSAPLAGLALTIGLDTVWLAEALLAATAAAALTVLNTHARRRPRSHDHPGASRPTGG